MKSPARLRYLTPLAILVLAVGCSDLYTGDSAVRPKAGVADSNIIASSYQAAERLLHGSRQTLDKRKPIIVASLVSVANMNRSSNLGRIISEQIASRLTQLGYETRELKFRGSLLIRAGQGQYVLSRALRDISKEQQAQAVIAGVYAVAKTSVYLTLELIRAEDSTIIASYDYRLPLGPNTMALLEPFEN